MNKTKKCPNCKITWINEDQSIYDFYLNQGLTEERAEYFASMYGATKENKLSFYTNVIGIEDPKIYDGVSYWKCTNCNTVFDRNLNPQNK